MICDRCKKDVYSRTGSIFNEEMICMPCKEIEMVHPLYKEAFERERAEVLKGNMNYEGIGLPEDLRQS
jgi:hypothetical protein